MAVREILKMGHPVLGRTANAVESNDLTALDDLVEDMLEAMQAAEGAGLAAPQIGVELRVMIFSVDQNPRYPEAESVPQTVLVNPQFDVIDEQLEYGWEGCLSVPGLRGLVGRPGKICYRGTGLDGQMIERTVDGFHARVFQHEFDHLDGILYPQRMQDIRYLVFESEWEKFLENEQRLL